MLFAECDAYRNVVAAGRSERLPLFIALINTEARCVNKPEYENGKEGRGNKGQATIQLRLGYKLSWILPNWTSSDWAFRYTHIFHDLELLNRSGDFTTYRQNSIELESTVALYIHAKGDLCKYNCIGYSGFWTYWNKGWKADLSASISWKICV